MSNETPSGALTITITIADRPYRLKINRSEEEMVRRAAKAINDKINSYSLKYAHKDKQDLVAMIALQNTTSLLEYEDKETVDPEIMDKIGELDKYISDHIVD